MGGLEAIQNWKAWIWLALSASNPYKKFTFSLLTMATSISGEFKDRVQQWVTIDTQIKAAASDMKDLRKRNNDLKAWIMDYMEENGIDVCNIMNRTQTLRVMHRESSIKPRKEEVIEKMSAFLQQRGVSGAGGGDLYKFVFEDGAQKRKGRNLSRRKRSLKRARTEATIDEVLEEQQIDEDEEEEEEDLGTV